MDICRDDKNNDDKKYNFVYRYCNNNVVIKDNVIIDYINKLAIPPAWTNVKISKNKNNKLLATGYDSKNRKQYIYNQKFTKLQEINKYKRLIQFGENIHKMQQTISNHFKLPDYHKLKTLSMVLFLIIKTNMRVGKEEYVKSNKSYGATSIRKSHVNINKKSVTFNFKGKSNKQLKFKINHTKFRYYIEQLMKLPGENLFQFKMNDNIKTISSKMLNTYVKDYMGKFFVKDFRTFGANLIFLKTLANSKESTINKNINHSVDKTAEKLKNTPSIAKKSYIVKFIIDEYKKDPEKFKKNYKKINNPKKYLLSLLNKYYK